MCVYLLVHVCIYIFIYICIWASISLCVLKKTIFYFCCLKEVLKVGCSPTLISTANFFPHLSFIHWICVRWSNSYMRVYSQWRKGMIKCVFVVVLVAQSSNFIHNSPRVFSRIMNFYKSCRLTPTHIHVYLPFSNITIFFLIWKYMQNCSKQKIDFRLCAAKCDFVSILMCWCMACV